MRNTQLLRFGLASLTLLGAGLATFLIACGDDDNEPITARDGGGVPETSTTIPDSGGPTDSGVVDAGPPNAKLQVVNAATNLGPGDEGAVRVCYGAGATAETAKIVGLPPLPDKVTAPRTYAGLFAGTGGAVEGTGSDLSQAVIVPYIMSASKLKDKGVVKPEGQSGLPCDALLGTGDSGVTLTLNVDYWKLDPIPAGTLLKGKSYILALTGCAATAAAALGAKCGPGFTHSDTPGNGNLKATIFEVDRATAIAADKVGAQFIHVSAAGDAVITTGGGLLFKPAFMQDPTDAGTATTVSPGNVALGGKTDLVQVGGVKFDAPAHYFTANPNANPATFPIAIPLNLIQQLSYGATVPDGGAYRNGAAFTFIALGDPTESSDGGAGGAIFNTKKFHYIALPNDPAQPTYKP